MQGGAVLRAGAWIQHSLVCTWFSFAVLLYPGSENPVLVAGYKSGTLSVCFSGTLLAGKDHSFDFQLPELSDRRWFQHLFIACSIFLPAASLAFQILECALCCSGEAGGFQSVLSSCAAYLCRWALHCFVILQLTKAQICSSGVHKGQFKLAVQWEVLSFLLLNSIMGKWWIGGL